ncbi:ABC transporter ATP-binding protein/permease [Candidatus Dependentiae bacterium]|nr:ABC transporter ATP-binding protein/permease [Candidatus Dependentiae bacterium]
MSQDQLRSHLAYSLIRELLRQYPWYSIGSIILVACYALLQLINPHIISMIIEGIPNKSFPLLLIGCILIGLQSCLQLCKASLTYVGTAIGLAVAHRLYALIVGNVLHHSRTFHRENPAELLVDQIDRDISIIATYSGEFFTTVAPQMLVLIGVVCYLVWMQPLIGIITAILIAIVLIILQLLNQRAMHVWHRVNASKLAMLQLVTQLLERRHTFFMYESNAEFIEQIRTVQQETIAVETDAILTTSRTWVVLIACTTIMIGGAMVSGYVLGQQHLINLGAIFVLINYAQLIQNPLEKLGELNKKYTRVFAALQRLQELQAQYAHHEYIQQFQRSSVTKELQELSPTQPITITIEHLTIGYTHQAPLLQNLSCTIGPTERLLLVIPSGMGKTTIARVLSGTEQPLAGNILVNNIPLTSMPATTRCQFIGSCTVPIHITASSIADNISLFEPLPEEYIHAVLERYHLQSALQLLQINLATILHEPDKVSLSVRQLIGIARLMLHETPVIVLDQPLVPFDQELQEIVAASLRLFLQDKTTIILHHSAEPLLNPSVIIKLGQHHA